MFLEEALEFVRNTDSDIWNQLIKEMRRTTKRRDLEAGAHFNVGELVSCELPDQTLRGRIIKIARGRVTLAVPSSRTGFLERIAVPASILHRLHDSGEPIAISTFFTSPLKGGL
jgi:hypothetical protein